MGSSKPFHSQFYCNVCNIPFIYIVTTTIPVLEQPKNMFGAKFVVSHVSLLLLTRK